jgi:hypothetical protein
MQYSPISKIRVLESRNIYKTEITQDGIRIREIS